MDHGVWHQARDAAGRLYFFNDAGETRWDWPGGEAAPLAVHNAFAGALQQPAAAAGGNAPISRELAERCLGEMRRDKAELAAAADRESQLDAQLAAAVADRAALATAAAESRRAAADRAVACAAAAADAQLATAARLPDVEAAWARAWPAPAPTPPPDDDDLRQLLDGIDPAPPPEEEDDDDDDGMALDRSALLQPATQWYGPPTGGDSTDDDDTPPSPTPARPTRAPKRPKKLEDAAPAPKKRARVSIDGTPARDPPGATAAAPGSIMAAFQCQLSDTLWSKQQIKSLMPNEQGSHIPAVYAAGGVIYALCFSEDSNPGLPTVLEISCGARRKQQVVLLESLKQRGGEVPLFVCLQTACGRLELLPGGSRGSALRGCDPWRLFRYARRRKWWESKLDRRP